MRTTARIMLGLFGSLTICVDAAGQSMTRPGTQIIPQGPLTPKSAALQQATFNVICRGGPTLRVDPTGNGRSMVYFLPGRKLPGALGAGLGPGECSPLDRLFAAEEPPGIQFADKGGEESIATHRADSNRYWQFAVVKATGYFDARSYQRTLAVEPSPAGGIATKPATASAVAKKPGDEPQPTGVIQQPAGNVTNTAGKSAPGVDQLQQATFGILCRGGGTLRVDALQGGRHGVYFQKSERIPDRYGAALKPGECSPVDHPFAAEDPPGIQFSNIAGEESVQEHKAASDRYWRFDVVKTNYGYFDARRYERVLQPQAAADPATVSELAVGRISDVRVTPRDRSVRIDFIAAPDATPSVLIVRGPAKVDPNGVVLSWVGAPMVLSAQREANASSATVTRYIADSLSDRRHDPSHLSMLDPGAQYHYVISDNNDTSRRVGGVFTTPHAGASGPPAPAVASGTLPPASKQDDRGIIIVGGRDPAGEQAAAARVTQEDINKGAPGPPPAQAVSRPAEKVDTSLQQLLATNPRNVPPTSKTEDAELNEAAYRNPMNRVTRNQQARWKDSVATPTARGARFQFVWQVNKPQHAGAEYYESELPVVEVGLDKPQVAANGDVAFSRVSARATAGVYGGRPIPNDSSTWGQRLVLWAEIDGPLTPNTLYHYVISLPAEGGRQFEYGTFTTLDGVVSAGNRNAAAPAVGIPRTRRDTQLQGPSGAASRRGNAAQLSQRAALVEVTTHSRGAVLSHSDGRDTAYDRMRVQVSDRPPSLDSSGRFTLDRPIADVSASGKVGRVKVYNGAYETYVEQYSVECNVDGLAPGSRYYYIVTLTRIDNSAFHQERGTFTTLPRQE